jgi:SAM-dependent methyltransferase
MRSRNQFGRRSRNEDLKGLWYPRCMLRRLAAFKAKAKFVAPRVSGGPLFVHSRDDLPAAVKAALESRSPPLEPYAELALAWHEHGSAILPRYGDFARWLIDSGAVKRHRALDVACGTGITTRALADLFENVLAFDINLHMLRQATANLSGLPNVHCIRADFRCFSVDEHVDLAICAGDSLNYVESTEELEDTFRCVAEALHPGGVFLFDLESEASFRMSSRFVFQYRTGSLEWYQAFNYDPKTRRDDACAITERGVETHRRMYLSITDVYTAAGRAGFGFAERFDTLPYLAISRGVRDFYALRKIA